MKLTATQRELLEWLNSTNGVIDISDERMVSRLIDRGLAMKFFETHGADLRPVWAITPAGRAKLEEGR